MIPETVTELQPGPAMDRAVGERMGVEPGCGVQTGKDGEAFRQFASRASAQRWIGTQPRFNDYHLVPVYPAYSTSSAWEQVADWLEAQGYLVAVNGLNEGGYACEFWPKGQGTRTTSACGATRAEAVCRAALELPAAG